MRRGEVNDFPAARSCSILLTYSFSLFLSSMSSVQLRPGSVDGAAAAVVRYRGAPALMRANDERLSTAYCAARAAANEPDTGDQSGGLAAELGPELKRLGSELEQLQALSHRIARMLDKLAEGGEVAQVSCASCFPVGSGSARTRTAADSYGRQHKQHRRQW